MRLDLNGRIALVTGASRGIGRAIADELHGEGCRVALNARTAEPLRAAADALPGAIAVAGDVTRPEEARRVVREALAACGSIDILVCNVGSRRSVPLGQETAEEWQRVFQLNLWSATNMIEAARDALVQSKGVIICISSICGTETVSGAPVTYSAAKAALNAAVRGLARPLGRQGVRVHAVAPGNILFEGSVWARKQAEDSLAVDEMVQPDVALGRLGTAKEVAELVAFLASARAGFASGGVWTLDGGQTHS